MTEVRIPDPTLMARLQLSVKGVDWASSRVKAWQHEPFEGGWSAHQHLAHLLATEDNFQTRIKRTLEEDVPVLEPRSTNVPLAGHDLPATDIETLAEQFIAARTQTFETFKGLTPDEWRRTAVWTDDRVVDLSWVAEKVLWHALDHFATLLQIHQEFEPIQSK